MSNQIMPLVEIDNIALGDLCKFIDYRGKTPDKKSKGIPLITAKIVKDGRVQAYGEFIAESEYDSWMRRGIPKPEDVIITTEAPLGEIAEVPNEKVAFAQRIIVLSPDRKRLLPKYLKLSLQSPQIQKELRNRSSGSTVSGIRSSELNKVKVRVPEIADQKRIVETVENLFSKIDLGTRELENAKRKLELYRQSVLNAAIQGKLVPQDPNDEPASKLLERIRTEKEALVKAGKIKKEKPLSPISEDEIPFEIPKGWSIARLKDVINLYSGQHIEASDYNTNRKGTPYLTGPSDFGTKYPTITKWTTKPKVIAPPHSILITVKGSGVGKINYLLDEGVCISRQLMAVESIIMKSEYIEVFLHKSFEKLAMDAQGLIPGLSREDIENLICPIPPLGEQVRIVQKVKEAIEQSEKMTDVLDENFKRANQLKQSILKKAFEGEL